MTPISDDAHFLQSLSVDLTNRGETYYGQRCGEIAARIAELEAEVERLRTYFAEIYNMYQDMHKRLGPGEKAYTGAAAGVGDEQLRARIAELEAEVERLRTVDEFKPIYDSPNNRLRARIAELEAEADRRNQQFLSLNEHIFGLEAEIERLKDQLREPCNDAEFGMKP